MFKRFILLFTFIGTVGNLFHGNSFHGNLFAAGDDDSLSSYKKSMRESVVNTYQLFNGRSPMEKAMLVALSASAMYGAKFILDELGIVRNLDSNLRGLSNLFPSLNKLIIRTKSTIQIARDVTMPSFTKTADQLSETAASAKEVIDNTKPFTELVKIVSEDLTKIYDQDEGSADAQQKLIEFLDSDVFKTVIKSVLHSQEGSSGSVENKISAVLQSIATSPEQTALANSIIQTSVKTFVKESGMSENGHGNGKTPIQEIFSELAKNKTLAFGLTREVVNAYRGVDAPQQPYIVNDAIDYGYNSDSTGELETSDDDVLSNDGEVFFDAVETIAGGINFSSNEAASVAASVIGSDQADIHRANDEDAIPVLATIYNGYTEPTALDHLKGAASATYGLVWRDRTPKYKKLMTGIALTLPAAYLYSKMLSKPKPKEKDLAKA